MYFNADVNTMLRFGWTIMRCSLLYAQVIVNALPTHLLLSPIRITSHHTLFLFDRILCQTHFLVFSIASEHYSLKLLTSIALLLEELQHIQHRGAPQSETQLTIAQALPEPTHYAQTEKGEAWPEARHCSRIHRLPGHSPAKTHTLHPDREGGGLARSQA